MSKFILFFIIFSYGIAPIHAEMTNCNPVVTLNKSNSKLSEVLVLLANENNFSLNFPTTLDRKININETMPLDKMITYLTRSMNTVLQHTEDENCTGRKLSDLEFLPTGKATEFIEVKSKPIRNFNTRPTPGRIKANYKYIKDMEQYVQDVIDGKRKADKRNMTPEQKQIFQQMKRKLKRKPRNANQVDTDE